MGEPATTSGAGAGPLNEATMAGTYPAVGTTTRRNAFYRVWCFYRDGFRSMTLGRTLWAIILIKLFIMFAILRMFFFPNALGGLSDEQKSDRVMENLTEIKP